MIRLKKLGLKDTCIGWVQRQPTLNVIAIGLLVLIVIIPIAGLEKTVRIIVTIVIMNLIKLEDNTELTNEQKAKEVAKLETDDY